MTTVQTSPKESKKTIFSPGSYFNPHFPVGLHSTPTPAKLWSQLWVKGRVVYKWWDDHTESPTGSIWGCLEPTLHSLGFQARTATDGHSLTRTGRTWDRAWTNSSEKAFPSPSGKVREPRVTPTAEDGQGGPEDENRESTQPGGQWSAPNMLLIWTINSSLSCHT